MRVSRTFFGGCYRLFITSPDRFPRRWKALPSHTQLVGGLLPGPSSVARWNGHLLLLVTDSVDTILYSSQTNSWISCDKPRHLLVESSELENTPAWFRDSFYLKCNVATEEYLRKMEEFLSIKTTEDGDEEEEEEDDEPEVFSIMRFDVGERRWYELELSGGDVGLLSSGLSVPLAVHGRLLVFSAAWGYLQSSPYMEEYYVCDEQAKASWDGRSNPFKVYSLEDDLSREDWSEASLSRRKNMKKLVDVTEQGFSRLVDTAWERKAGRFFTGDGSCGDDVLFWITSDAELDRYNVPGDELLGPPAKFHYADEPTIEINPFRFPTGLHLVHQDPGRPDSVFSLFEGLPEINDFTSDEELRGLVSSSFKPREG